MRKKIEYPRKFFGRRDWDFTIEEFKTAIEVANENEIKHFNTDKHVIIPMMLNNNAEAIKKIMGRNVDQNDLDELIESGVVFLTKGSLGFHIDIHNCKDEYDFTITYPLWMSKPRSKTIFYYHDNSVNDVNQAYEMIDVAKKYVVKIGKPLVFDITNYHGVKTHKDNLIIWFGVDISKNNLMLARYLI